jgi:signal transduction histidine kinase
MKRPVTTRTSLAARMGLLFGLLATGPLVVSGLLISLSSWRGVRDSGEQVAAIGRETLTSSRERFLQVAASALESATRNVAEEARRQLDQTARETAQRGSQALRANTSMMSREGRLAVGEATRQTGEVSRQALQASLRRLQERNQASLQALSERFATEMLKEVDRQSSPLEDGLRVSLLEAWKQSADRRAASVQDRATRAQFDIIRNLQYPIRTVEFARGEDEVGVRSLFESQIRREFYPEVVRAVLVSPTGVELARVPESEPEEDWAAPGNRTRQLFFSPRNRASYLIEPMQQDRTGRWIQRVVHAVPNPDAPPEVPGPEGESEPPPATVMAMTRPPSSLVVVDFLLSNIVTEAIRDQLPAGLEIHVIRGDTGVIVSSSDRTKTNATSRTLLEALSRAGDPLAYQQKPYYFDYATPNESAFMQGAARYWGADENCWTVVLQSDQSVFQPVRELKRGINTAWRTALNKVKEDTDRFIQTQGEQAASEQRALLAAESERMRARELAVRRKIDESFQRAEQRVTRRLTEELEASVEQLSARTRVAMGSGAEAGAQAAAVAFGETARQETNRASAEIEMGANRVADQTAGRMLMNSTWLLPLFLVLALFLATLTARSLVKPINQLVQGTQALAAGDYTRRITVRGEDELARLAIAFNDMAGAIERGQSELQQSHDSLATEKARMEAIVQASPDGLVMLEPSGEVAFINPTASRLLGLGNADLPPSPFAVEALPAAAAATLRACLETAAAGEGVREYEIAEPQRCVLQVREVKLRALEGRSLGRLLHLHDITRERVIDEMKSDFISLVSHELRTPLTSILGFSSYLLTGRLGALADAQRQALESIHRQARRLTAIIADFLDISRIESGRIEMKKERVQITQVATRVMEDLRPQAAEKHVEVSTTIANGAAPLVASGDEQRIAQVFTNLIGNALKFTEPHGRVDVELARENGEVLCRVRDTGCGIPADELDRVFDRFYQVEKVVTRKSGGTGLGLAIVKNIIEAHGGRVWIESEVGRGTQVSFTLPGSDE